MKKETLDFRIDFDGKIEKIKNLNSNFTLCNAKILACGQNRNGSLITKEATQKAIKNSLYNTPIIGHLYKTEDGNLELGGHDAVLEKNADGKYILKSICIPYGVISESCNVKFEMIKDSDGIEREYATAEVILWTGRWPEILDAIGENKSFGQSVEITANKVSKGQGKDKGFVVIEDFDFSALTLLGSDVEPCFLSASVTPIEYAFADEFAKTFSELKQELSACFSHNKNYPDDGKGGNIVDKNFETEPTVDTETNPVKTSETDTVQETKATETFLELVEVTTKATNEEPKVETDEAHAPQESAVEPVEEYNFAVTYKSKYETLCAAVNALSIYAKDSVKSYYLMDFDENYVFVEKYFADINEPSGRYTKARMTYSVNAEESANISEASFEKVFSRWLTESELGDLDRLKIDNASLMAYKANHEKADKERDFSLVLEEFDDLEGEDEFKEVKEKMLDFSTADALKEKCFALRGRKIVPKKELRFTVGNEKVKEPQYGGFIEKYSKN